MKFYFGSKTFNTTLASSFARTHSSGTGTSTQPLQIGGNGTNAFNGMLDELRIYDGFMDIMGIDSVRRQGAIRNSGVGTGPIIDEHPATVIVTGLFQRADFAVTDDSNPNPVYQWRKNGTNILGATDRILTILSATHADYGAYDVLVQNAYGTATSQIAELLFKVDFLAQSPTNVYVYPGDTAYIAMQLTPGNNGYRWVSNSVTMAGFNTNVLTLVNFRNTNSPSF